MNTPPRLRILGISGSLRRQSFNTALLLSAQANTGGLLDLDIATLHDIPLYNGDDEQSSGIPAAVEALKARIVACDGLLIATPEYNNSIPGVLKNAVDWLSRPPADIARIFGNRPVAIIGASPSGFGTILSQNAWLPVMRTLGTRQWTGGRLLVSGANKVFNAEGALTSDVVRRQIQEFLTGFARFVREERDMRALSPPIQSPSTAP